MEKIDTDKDGKISMKDVLLYILFNIVHFKYI